MKLPNEFKQLQADISNILKPMASVKSDVIGDIRVQTGIPLPEYYLVYFLLSDIMNFYNSGEMEKTAWSFPITFNNRLYSIEYRKFGLGIFTSKDNDQKDTEAKIIAKKIIKTIQMAIPYFDWLAENAVSDSRFNINNRSSDLYQRYLFLRNLYTQKMEEAEERKDESVKEEKKFEGGSSISFSFPATKLREEANWLAISAIEAFFSWTEHFFILASVIQGNVTKGEEIADLINADWAQKYKSAIKLSGSKQQKFYNELLIVRRQLRNFVAHGSFGKNGETFSFHSETGAVPVLMPHKRNSNKYSLNSELTFEEGKVLDLIDEFILSLKSEEMPATYMYIQDTYLPVILTMTQNGMYNAALKSEKDMEEFIEMISNEFDRAADMDW